VVEPSWPKARRLRPSEPMVQGARPEHGDDRSGEDGCRSLGTRSPGRESEDDAKRDGRVESPLVEDTAKTWLQLAASGGSHETNRSRLRRVAPGQPRALLQLLLTKSESGLRI
jgi:hypothetical protein